MDEMLMMKIRLQLKQFRHEIDQSAQKRDGSNNNDDHEEKRLKGGVSYCHIEKIHTYTVDDPNRIEQKKTLSSIKNPLK